MNTLAIAPQLTLNLLQNMNIKRDTLEKRAIGKSQFQETPMFAEDTTSSPTTAPAAAIPEYTPSVDDQYLPKSLRGTNPYSIMNTMTESVTSSSSAPAKLDAVDLEIAAAAAQTDGAIHATAGPEEALATAAAALL